MRWLTLGRNAADELVVFVTRETNIDIAVQLVDQRGAPSSRRNLCVVGCNVLCCKAGVAKLALWRCRHMASLFLFFAPQLRSGQLGLLALSCLGPD